MITIIFVYFFVKQLGQASVKRQYMVLGCCCLYLLITIFDLIRLETVYDMSFHFSDPTDYYYKQLNKSWWSVVSKNWGYTFYNSLNWYYGVIYDNSTIASLFLKVNNVFVCMITFLLITKHKSNIGITDYVWLLNPYTIMVTLRNNRDMFIILFVVMILIGIGVYKGYKLGRGATFFAIIMLLLTRAVLLGPLFLVFCYQNKYLLIKSLRQAVLISMIIMIWLNIENILTVIGKQITSVLIFMEESPIIYNEYAALMDGNYGLSVILLYVKRIITGLIVFLFSPHPIKYISKWTTNMDSTGAWNIYTDIDNFLIFAGSIFSYLFFYPIFFAVFLNIKKINKATLLFATMVILLYSIAYLGITDIRNHNLAFTFILLTFIFADSSIKVNRKCYLLTLVVFIVYAWSDSKLNL
jgi:hypothetical protein